MAAVSCAGLLAGLGAAAPAAASASRGNGAAAPSYASWTSVQPPGPGTGNSLGGVARPNPGGSNGNGSLFTGVAAASASSVWAVGGYFDGTADLTLIARWNGTRWKQVASPNPAGTSTFDANHLNGVATASAGSVWAVGSWAGTAGAGALAIHRC